MTLPWSLIPSLNTFVAGGCEQLCCSALCVWGYPGIWSHSASLSVLRSSEEKVAPLTPSSGKKSFLWPLLSFFLSPLLLTLSYNVWKVYGNWEHKFQVKVMPLTILLHIWLASYTWVPTKFAFPCLLLFHHHITDTNGRRCGRTSRRWTSFPSSYKAPA